MCRQPPDSTDTRASQAVEPLNYVTVCERAGPSHGWSKMTCHNLSYSPNSPMTMTPDLTANGGTYPASRGRPITLLDAVRAVGKSHDLRQVISFVLRGGD
jgi:hypothetical protein